MLRSQAIWGSAEWFQHLELPLEASPGACTVCTQAPATDSVQNTAETLTWLLEFAGKFEREFGAEISSQNGTR